ncbi:autotransporter outer membrane beta-barrel domain-containing protein [Pseudomonas sp. SWRI111]|uniref:autotransporter outer membrane beta-barrel domain-containing protein n=1 Tax=Pseudomonas sp. SWRI111 TaxID=2745507 RepID=UPI001648E038|nr:autotransporter outer membrane beta-barrel domain-containing protein [Pseudomonas sp. SWRI111]MBC3209345.1 autotransporter outer membrane beta-barrel domain-containing protein [Pseudomonas sp. SWRI111]
MPAKAKYGLVSMVGGVALEVMTMGSAHAVSVPDLVLDGVTVDVTGNNFPGVRDAGSAFAISIRDSVITANGQFSHGVLLSGGDSSVQASDSTVSTLGEASHGFNFAGASQSGELSRVAVSTAGDNAFALNLGQGAQVRATDVSLTTVGRFSSAADLSGGSALSARGGRFNTSGDNAHGLFLLGTDTLQRALASLTDSEIRTAGDNAIALNVNRNATATLADSRITTLGANAYGVWVPNADSQLLANNLSIDTQGDNAIGVFTQLGGKASLDGGNVHTQGSRAYALYAGNVSSIEARNLSLQVGADSVGAFASDRSQISLAQIDLRSDQTTIGLASYSGSTIEAVDSSVSLSGTGARAVQANNGATVRLDNLGIQAVGTDSIGLQSLASAGVSNTFEVKNSQLEVANGRAISVQGGSARIDLVGSRLSADTLLAVDQRTLADGRVIDSEDVLVKARESNLSGAIQANARNSQLLLKASSNLSGTARGLNVLTLDQSNWDMTGHSQIGQLNLDQGQVRFSAPSHSVLAIDGDLTGNGTFMMNTDLASEQGDLITVGGSIEGAHTLVVKDSGQEPAAANGKLMLVDGNGGAGRFSLYGGHVDAGAFRYTLEQRADDWYLVNAAGIAPVNPVAPAPAQLSAGANAAIASQTAAATLWSAQMNTLVKRLGELRLGKDEGGVWTRAIGSRYNIAEHSSRAFSQNNTGIEIGADKAIGLAGGKVYVGGMLGTAKSELNFGEGASGEIESRMLGGYATYLNDNGVYVDSVIKYSRFDNDLKLPTNVGKMVKGSYSANGYGVDVEVGKHIKLKDDWFVEPQVELMATRTTGANYTASNGLRVNAGAMNSLQSRVGSLFGRSLELANGMQAQPYAKASYIAEHGGDSHVRVNGHKLKSELPGNRVELGFGAILQVSERSKVSLDAEFAKGNDIEQPWGVTLGYRYLW